MLYNVIFFLWLHKPQIGHACKWKLNIYKSSSWEQNMSKLQRLVWEKIKHLLVSEMSCHCNYYYSKCRGCSSCKPDPKTLTSILAVNTTRSYHWLTCKHENNIFGLIKSYNHVLLYSFLQTLTKNLFQEVSEITVSENACTLQSFLKKPSNRLLGAGFLLLFPSSILPYHRHRYRHCHHHRHLSFLQHVMHKASYFCLKWLLRTQTDTYTFKKKVHMWSLVNKKSDRMVVYCNLSKQFKEYCVMKQHSHMLELEDLKIKVI